MRAAAGWLAVVALLLVACGERSDVTSLRSDPTAWPWQTAPPTAHLHGETASAAEDVPSALVTVTASPTLTLTPTPTSTSTPEPAETPSASAAPAGSEPSEPSENPRAALERLEAEAVALTNAERSQRGCPEVRVNDLSFAAALGHSEDMAARNYFSHESPDGDGPSDRARAAGYDGFRSENIAMGQSTAEQVIEAWMDSPGHRRNILNCQSDEVAIAVADSPRGLYWTQMFGRSSNAPTP